MRRAALFTFWTLLVMPFTLLVLFTQCINQGWINNTPTIIGLIIYILCLFVSCPLSQGVDMTKLSKNEKIALNGFFLLNYPTRTILALLLLGGAGIIPEEIRNNRELTIELVANTFSFGFYTIHKYGWGKFFMTFLFPVSAINYQFILIDLFSMWLFKYIVITKSTTETNHYF